MGWGGTLVGGRKGSFEPVVGGRSSVLRGRCAIVAVVDVELGGSELLINFVVGSLLVVYFRRLMSS